MRRTIAALCALVVLGMAVVPTAAAEAGDDPIAACTLDNPPSHCYVGPVNCSFSDGWTSPDCWTEPYPIAACTLDWPPSHCYVGPVNCSFSDGLTEPECWIDR